MTSIAIPTSGRSRCAAAAAPAAPISSCAPATTATSAATLLRREPPQRLERDVDTRAVVEVARRYAAGGELDRRGGDDHRIAGGDERPGLRAVARADVHVELAPLDLLVVPRAARDDAGHGSVRRADLDPLPVRDGRPPAAERVDGDEPVVVHVRGGEPDHVEVREEREQRPVSAPGTPCDQVPDRVGLDLGDVAHALADRAEGEVLVPCWAMRAQ